MQETKAGDWRQKGTSATGSAQVVKMMSLVPWERKSPCQPRLPLMSSSLSRATEAQSCAHPGYSAPKTWGCRALLCSSKQTRPMSTTTSARSALYSSAEAPRTSFVQAEQGREALNPRTLPVIACAVAFLFCERTPIGASPGVSALDALGPIRIVSARCLLEKWNASVCVAVARAEQGAICAAMWSAAALNRDVTILVEGRAVVWRKELKWWAAVCCGMCELRRTVVSIDKRWRVVGKCDVTCTRRFSWCIVAWEECKAST